MPNLRPLVILTESHDCRINCYRCGKLTRYNAAAVKGWTYDPDGPAYRAYYCPDCTKAKQAESPKR